MSVLVLIEHPDPTGWALAEAAAALGHRVSVLDVSRDRIDLAIGAEPRVWVNGVRLEPPSMLVNRTSVNGLGPVPTSALARQPGRTWYERHSSAREEQGELLGMFEIFRHWEVTFVNPPETTERHLMRNLTIERALRSGVRFGDGDVDAEWLVVGGRVLVTPGQERPDDVVVRLCRIVAQHGALDLAKVAVGSEDGRAVCIGWDPRPDLTVHDERIAAVVTKTVAEQLLGRGAHDRVTSPLRPFIPDMVERHESS